MASLATTGGSSSRRFRLRTSTLRVDLHYRDYAIRKSVSGRFPGLIDEGQGAASRLGVGTAVGPAPAALQPGTETARSSESVAVGSAEDARSAGEECATSAFAGS